MKLFSSKRRVATVAGVIVLALFLLRPGASRLKSRIITSISAGVGRPVDIGAVHIRLLPQPGFDLDNLVVYDDPAFGAEPIVRASEVTADLRLMSLVRGRLEISRLNLTEPSLNLVHRPDGRWNMEALLERTAHTPLAPTSKAKSEPRPAFPYIEGTSGRINFKTGPEKKPYALTSADFAFWQDSENTWGMRIKAQPFRSDFNLNDTGSLQVSGTWQRADVLRETPLKFNIEWSHAQLGQVTKFFTGADKGWRGGIVLELALTGTPAQLKISGDASVEDFRRYDITSGQALRLAAHCDGEYSTVSHEFHGVMCNAPVGNGMITFTGDMGLPGSHRYEASLGAENVPAGAALMLAERVKKNLPEDLTATGTLRGNFSVQEDAASQTQPRFEGKGEIADLQLSSVANKVEFGPQTVPFLLPGSEKKKRPALKSAGMQFPDGAHIEIGPVVLGPGRVNATLRGWLNRGGYDFEITGEAEIARTLRLARLAGLPAPNLAVEGPAQVDLDVSGAWTGQSVSANGGFVGPQITGTAKLRNVEIAHHGLGGPIGISSADLQLAADLLHITKLNAKAAGTEWTGSIDMPRGCPSLESCPLRFTLNASQLSLYGLHEFVKPDPKKRPWYRVLESKAQAVPSPLASLRASGRLTADRLQVHGALFTHVSANVGVDGGKLRLSTLSGDLYGGKHRGDWQADFSVKPAVCEGKGIFTGVALRSLVDAMNDNWISGTGNASYELKGACPGGFWPSAEGTLQVEMANGTFSHVLIGDNADPLRVTRLSGRAELHAGKIEIREAKIESQNTIYELNGTATLTRELELKLTRVAGGASAGGYVINGTLAEPQVKPLAGVEQARLKPAAAAK